MTTDLVVHGQPVTTLTIADDQARFTDQQVAALRHMGVQDASDGDLGVFFHVVKRTGLDPFARQIYMISRQVSEKDARGEWVRVTKQTIQTGIDGFRLIGRRAADARREAISVAAPQWAHQDGGWREVWVPAWGLPVAARVTITRGGSPFTAVALFDEYKQTKRNGELTSMWQQRPAGQIAKCAEALAWRLAFPQDLAGVYADDEMGQADNAAEPPTQPVERSGAARMRAAVAEPPTFGESSAQDPEPYEAEVIDGDGPITDRTRGQMFALLTEQGITDPDQQRHGMTKILGREVTSRATLTEDEGRTIVLELQARAQAGGAS